MNGDAFVSGNGYSIESTQFDRNTNTQSHYLTIHEATPGAYTCMLISASRKVIVVLIMINPIYRLTPNKILCNINLYIM